MNHETRRVVTALRVWKTQKKRGFLIVVGSSVSKRATTRNLVKRRLRSILRGFPAPLYAVRIVAGKDAALVSFDELRESVRHTLRSLLI